MSELIKNEIGDNKISKKIGDINWVEAKIKDSYKEIYEKKQELQSLQAELANNLSGDHLKQLIEDNLTTDHVKSVLQQAVTKFDAEPGMLGFNKVYGEMGAGLTFNLQLALAKLGGKFTRGIDGLYGSKDTRKRVREFQEAWNNLYPDQKISTDGWAGQNTLHKIMLALDDPKWDKTKVGTASTETAPATPDKSAPAPQDGTAPVATPDSNKTTPATGASDTNKTVTPAAAPQKDNPPAVDVPAAAPDVTTKEEKKSDKTADKKAETKKLSALEKKYEEAADFFEKTLNDASLDAMQKVILVEKRVVADIKDTPKAELPKPDSRYAVLRDRANADAKAYLDALAFVKPAFMNLTPVEGYAKLKTLTINRDGYKTVDSNYNALISLRKSLSGDENLLYTSGKIMWFRDYITQLLSSYIKHSIDAAFYGTKINTKSFKIFLTNEEGDAKFQSYGHQTELNMNKNTIKDLNIKFSDRSETIRMANLINMIRSNYHPSSSNEARFVMSPSGEIEQKNASSKRFSDLNILTDYTNFPTLKGKANNENKRKLIDYLNKTLANVETKKLNKKDFAALLVPEARFRSNVNYEEKYPDYLNKLTADKINRAITQLKKEGYIIDKLVFLGGGTFLLDPDWLVKTQMGRTVYQLDMGQSRTSMLNALKKEMKKPVAPAKAPAKTPAASSTINASKPINKEVILGGKKIEGRIISALQKQMPGIDFNKIPNIKDVPNFTGLGYMLFDNGSIYVGQRKNDKQEWRGIEIRESWAKYEGEFKNGKMEGKGIYTYANWEKYEGEFKNGKTEGKGIYTYANWEKYEGEFKNGKREGKGIYTYANWEKYEGQYKSDEVVPGTEKKL